jgi:hypothetical protein
MNDFREALARFREAVHHEGERSGSPGLQTVLKVDRRSKNIRLRWAVAAVVVLTLGAIPPYRIAQQRHHEAEQEKADALLLRKVNAGLSRSVPRAMAPLMNWNPGN